MRIVGAARILTGGARIDQPCLLEARHYPAATCPPQSLALRIKLLESMGE